MIIFPPLPLFYRIRSPSPHVWLRGNMRCAWMFGIFALLFELIAALSVVMVFIKPVNQVVWWPLAIVSGAVAVALAILTWEVAQPRIQHRGVFLVVHLSPFRYERIPLNIVECFFVYIVINDLDPLVDLNSVYKKIDYFLGIYKN
ncbi:MAG: hypothetical protein ABGW78_09925 [Pirellulales bacterium]